MHFRSHSLHNIPEEDAEVEYELGVDADEHLVIGGEENDVGLVMARLPDSIDEDLVDDDNQLQSIAASLPLIAR